MAAGLQAPHQFLRLARGLQQLVVEVSHLLQQKAQSLADMGWIRHIVAARPPEFPVILYAKGTAQHMTNQAFTGARVLSVDWTCDIAAVRRALPGNVAVQGNLDPVLLNTTPEIVRREARRLLESMRGRTGHIFNLGHGITPRARIECMEALVATVTGWRG